jgi:hypothetical protein
MGSEEKVVVKKEVEAIGEFCFFECQSLHEVIFEKGSKVERLEKSAFSGCSLDKIVIPASVKVIGEKCFCHCSSLCEIVYEGKVTDIDIGEGAFSWCPVNGDW